MASATRATIGGGCAAVADGQPDRRPVVLVLAGRPRTLTRVVDDAPLVRARRTGPVVTLTLDSPANRNALSARLLVELTSGLAEAASDPDVRAVVVTGSGTTFCSGADLRERLQPPAGEPPATLAEVLSAVVSAPKPVIARVNGHVRAGGMGIVAACDLAVAPVSATFAFSEVRVGVAPAVIAVPALRRMQRRAWERWALTGDVFGAADAVAAGLLSATVPDEAGLDAWVRSAVTSVLRSAPEAVAATKGLPDLVGRPWEAALGAAEELSDALFGSAAAREGMAAFLEKRKPSWVAMWEEP